MSNSSEARTSESTPETVPQPHVTSPSPSQLNVICLPPRSPNGQSIELLAFVVPLTKNRSRSSNVKFHSNSRQLLCVKKVKVARISIAERRVPQLILVLGSQPAGDVSHEPGGGLPLLSTRPAVTLATIKRVATSLAAW